MTRTRLKMLNSVEKTCISLLEYKPQEQPTHERNKLWLIVPTLLTPQMRRIVSIVGQPPNDVLELGLNTDYFFNETGSNQWPHRWTLKVLTTVSLLTLCDQLCSFCSTLSGLNQIVVSSVGRWQKSWNVPDRRPKGNQHQTAQSFKGLWNDLETFVYMNKV